MIQKTFSENCDSSGRVVQSQKSGLGTRFGSLLCHYKDDNPKSPTCGQYVYGMRVKTLGMAQHVAAEIQAKARAIGKTVVNQIEALGDDKEFSNTELHVHLNHELGE